MKVETGDEKETLIFVHIPKTAGATFSSILARLYPSNVLSAYSSDAVANLGNLPETVRAQTSLLQGHFLYGVHSYMPRPSKYVTFLRDPVDRVISLYYFGLENPEIYFHKRIVEDNLSLVEFVESTITSETDNFQVRTLASSVQPGAISFAPIDETTLPLAKQRLASNFAAFGLTERFDESLLLLSRTLDWPLWGGKLFYQRKNKTDRRKPLAKISPEAIATIRRHNELDIQLYEYACELFDERIQGLPGFRTQLQMYQTLNQGLNKGISAMTALSKLRKRKS